MSKAHALGGVPPGLSLSTSRPVVTAAQVEAFAFTAWERTRQGVELVSDPVEALAEHRRRASQGARLAMEDTWEAIRQVASGFEKPRPDGSRREASPGWQSEPQWDAAAELLRKADTRAAEARAPRAECIGVWDSQVRSVLEAYQPITSLDAVPGGRPALHGWLALQALATSYPDHVAAMAPPELQHLMRQASDRLARL